MPLPVIENGSERNIPVRGQFACGHWGVWMLTRDEWDEWYRSGAHPEFMIGVPGACDRCPRNEKDGAS